MENNNHCEHNKMIDCNVHNCFDCGWNPVVKEERINNWKNNDNDFYWDLLMEQHEQM